MRWFGSSCGEELQAAEGQSGTLSLGPQVVTGQDLQQFFLEYVRQKQIAEGDLPDTDEEAGQSLEKSVFSLEEDCDP